MHFSTFTLLTALVGAVAARPSLSPHVLHEKREVLPKTWAKRSTVPRGRVFPMRIGLTQSNLDRAEEFLMDVSHPESPNYGKHYTAESIVELFAPSKERVEAVKEWLHSVGVDAKHISLSANKQWLQFDANVEDVEEMFKTKYHTWEHLPTGKTNIACDEYHVPQDIQEHIDYIMPGLRLLAGKDSPKLVQKTKQKRQAPGPIGGPVPGLPIPPGITNATNAELLTLCDTAITPPCIAAMYNITQAKLHHKGNELGIFEEGDFYAAEDLALFFATFAQNIPVTTEPILEGIDGGMPLPVATGESDLDFQISYPIIYPQQSILFQTDSLLYTQTELDIGSGIFNTFLDAVDGSYCNKYPKIDPKYPEKNPLGYQGKRQCGVYKPTNVVSFSYGEVEASFPLSYQVRQCHEFMKLGMQGTTIVFASGDSGVAARYTIDGNSNGCLQNGTVFAPDFPASCPYLTSTGATFLPKGGDPKKDQEVAVDRFPSGGGFSNVYKRPSYQASAVNTYLSNYEKNNYPSYSLSKGYSDPPASVTKGGIYNKAGRGFPDVSAIGDNVVIFLDGTPQLIGGTSAAAPVFAAIINRINEERLKVGKSTVGFVNPVLYAHPEVFNDITMGNNSGCGTPGFYASKGWDPVTGLGTPNYPALLKLFMGMK